MCDGEHHSSKVFRNVSQMFAFSPNKILHHQRNHQDSRISLWLHEVAPPRGSGFPFSISLYIISLSCVCELNCIFSLVSWIAGLGTLQGLTSYWIYNLSNPGWNIVNDFNMNSTITMQNMCVWTIKTFLCAIGVLVTQRDRRLPRVHIRIRRNVILKDQRGERSAVPVVRGLWLTSSRREKRDTVLLCCMCGVEACGVNSGMVFGKWMLWC